MKLSDLQRGTFKVEEPASLKLSDFHPSQYQVEDDQTSPVTSAVRQFVQGASAGFSDEAAGIAEAAGKAVGLKGLGGPMKNISVDQTGPSVDWETLKQAYKEGRDKERATLKADSAINPTSSAVGNFAGMVVSPVNRLGPVVAGAAMGAGTSDADNIKGLAKDTAIGGVLGYGAGKLGDKVAPMLEGAAEKVAIKSKDLAKNFSARAIGVERGTLKKLGKGRVLEAADQMLENGGLSPGASADDMIAKNNALKQKGADMMNQVYKAIDDKSASTFNPLDVAVDVEKKIGDFWRSDLNKAETSQFENTINSILKRGDKPISLQEAQVLKEEIKKAANFGKGAHLDVTPKEQMARDAYGVINDHIDKAVSDASGVVKDAGLNDVLDQGKTIYGNSKVAEKLLKNKQAREQGNKLIGLTDAITGVGSLGYGEATGDWRGATGIMLAKKGLERYGAQNAALVLNKVAKGLSNSPELANFAKSNPQAFNAIIQKLGQAFENDIPKAADNAPKPDQPAPKTGKAKWVADGLQNLKDHVGPEASSQLDKISSVIGSDKKLQSLLMSASDLNPGTKAMELILSKIKERVDQNPVSM